MSGTARSQVVKCLGSLTPAWEPPHGTLCLYHPFPQPLMPSAFSFSLIQSLTSLWFHRNFFVLLLYNLSCYIIISYSSLSHSFKNFLGAGTTSHQHHKCSTSTWWTIPSNSLEESCLLKASNSSHTPNSRLSHIWFLPRAYFVQN